ISPGGGLPGQDHCRISRPAAGLAAAVDALGTVRRPRAPEQFQQLLQDLATPDGPLSRFVYMQSFTGADGIEAWWRAGAGDPYPELRAGVRRLGGDALIEFPAPPFPAMVSSAPLSLAAAESLRTLGEVVTMHGAYPFNGEDFALFLQRIPGAM